MISQPLCRNGATVAKIKCKTVIATEDILHRSVNTARNKMIANQRMALFPTEPNSEGPDGLRAAGGQRDGVSGQQEVCSPRPGCQELHVSSLLFIQHYESVYHLYRKQQ